MTSSIDTHGIFPSHLRPPCRIHGHFATQIVEQSKSNKQIITTEEKLNLFFKKNGITGQIAQEIRSIDLKTRDIILLNRRIEFTSVCFGITKIIANTEEIHIFATTYFLPGSLGEIKETENWIVLSKPKDNKKVVVLNIGLDNIFDEREFKNKGITNPTEICQKIAAASAELGPGDRQSAEKLAKMAAENGPRESIIMNASPDMQINLWNITSSLASNKKTGKRLLSNSEHCTPDCLGNRWAIRCFW
jgi:hypothetical protein